MKICRSRTKTIKETCKSKKEKRKKNNKRKKNWQGGSPGKEDEDPPCQAVVDLGREIENIKKVMFWEVQFLYLEKDCGFFFFLLFFW